MDREESIYHKSGGTPLPLAGSANSRGLGRVGGGLANARTTLTSPPSVPPASGGEAQVANAHSIIGWLLRGLIFLYRHTLSLFLGRQCRFLPTCSDYADEAIRVHGAVKGSALALRRICRCHPWGGSGYDPVAEVGGSRLEVREK